MTAARKNGFKVKFMLWVVEHESFTASHPKNIKLDKY